jgi:hypothetical protein
MRIAGKIDIFDKFSYIEVPYAEWEIILKFFKKENPTRPVVVKAKARNSGSWRSRWGYRWNRWGSSFGNRRWNSRSGFGRNRRNRG